ncbi:hypothetical protein BDY19DRAFT_902731 [Irpex rosettiformis]|uniref:Uncharacterized protein n=1 Tax=Irpex rosettiformis TaxID=378272 RepID=A0ACB8UIX8_9APHY|nr:hypothetical protein BDY19DRAFT_902731 [Irpex rosettiformis]
MSRGTVRDASFQCFYYHNQAYKLTALTFWYGDGPEREVGVDVHDGKTQASSKLLVEISWEFVANAPAAEVATSPFDGHQPFQDVHQHFEAGTSDSGDVPLHQEKSSDKRDLYKDRATVLLTRFNKLTSDEWTIFERQDVRKPTFSVMHKSFTAQLGMAGEAIGLQQANRLGFRRIVNGTILASTSNAEDVTTAKDLCHFREPSVPPSQISLAEVGRRHPIDPRRFTVACTGSHSTTTDRGSVMRHILKTPSDSFVFVSTLVLIVVTSLVGRSSLLGDWKVRNVCPLAISCEKADYWPSDLSWSVLTTMSATCKFALGSTQRYTVEETSACNPNEIKLAWTVQIGQCVSAVDDIVFYEKMSLGCDDNSFEIGGRIHTPSYPAGKVAVRASGVDDEWETSTIQPTMLLPRSGGRQPAAMSGRRR